LEKEGITTEASRFTMFFLLKIFKPIHGLPLRGSGRPGVQYFSFLCDSLIPLNETQQLLEGLSAGDHKSLARVISLVENESPGYDAILKALTSRHTPVIGFTGPPGAGKSTLINALAGMLAERQKKIAIVAVDPTSPFNYGSLLADRIRMSERFNNPNIFIRSVATRGSLGGLSEKMIEITDVLKAAPFDVILIETVGVGQSEVEIAGLADTTVVVVVPESGDEIQAMKSGIMEIADVFVVNKCDRDGADTLVNTLNKSSLTGEHDTPVIKTSTVQPQGLEELLAIIMQPPKENNEKQVQLMTEKLYRIIQKKRMKGIDKKALAEKIRQAKGGKLNIYVMAEEYLTQI
jgi:LAO/AO transport system kinase